MPLYVPAGTTFTSGTNANKPSSGAYLTTDGFLQWLNGVPWGPIFPLTDPTTPSWVWVNQGGASVSTTQGGITLSCPTNASHALRVRKKSAPSRPYTIDAMFITNTTQVNSASDQMAFGLGYRESSSGKLHTLHAYNTSSVFTLDSFKWTDANTFSASYNATHRVMPGRPFFCRIAEDNTNRTLSWSCDGQNWTQLHQIGRTDFLTADEVFFFGDTFSTIYALNVLLLSWYEH